MDVTEFHLHRNASGYRRGIAFLLAQVSAALSRQALPLACIVLALGTLVVPVALTHMPPLLDYPNHLARIWLLAGGIDHAPLDAMYAADWSGASTNIGIDVIAVTLGRLIGGWTLAPLLLAAAVLLPPLGAVLLNRAVFGGWHWWQAGFAVLAWNSTLLAGFLNFQIGLGLALIGAALDPAIIRRAGPFRAMPLRMGLTAVLLVVHPFAAGFYGVLLAGLAFGSGNAFRNPNAPFWHRSCRAIGTVALSVGVPVACFLLLVPMLPGTHAPTGVYDAWLGYNLSRKLATLLTGFATYDLRFDALAMLLLVLASRITASEPAPQRHAGLLLASFGLVLLAFLCPDTLGGTAFLDWRFPIMAVLTAASAIRPPTETRRGGQVMAVALMLLAIGRTGWIAFVWQERQADVVAIEQVLAFVPPGAAIVPVEHNGLVNMNAPVGRVLAVGLPTQCHLPSLAVPLRHAFVPTLFTAPGKQPLRVLPPWNDVSVLEGMAAPVRFLHRFTPDLRPIYQFGFMAHWRERFDYVLVINAQEPDDDDEATLPELELLADRGFARLYRIIRSAPTKPAS